MTNSALLHSEPITLFEITDASSLTSGHGDAHIHWLHFQPGSSIGKHPTGFGQLFVVVEGSGWVASSDGHRVELSAGEAAYFERGKRRAPLGTAYRPD